MDLVLLFSFIFCLLLEMQILSGANAFRGQVMAGSGHLQTFKLLRFLRSRNSADGQVNYGVQMAVSFCIAYRLCLFFLYSISLHTTKGQPMQPMMLTYLSPYN